MIQPGQYFVGQLLQQRGLHLDGEELAGEGAEWERTKKVGNGTYNRVDTGGYGGCGMVSSVFSNRKVENG